MMSNTLVLESARPRIRAGCAGGTVCWKGGMIWSGERNLTADLPFYLFSISWRYYCFLGSRCERQLSLQQLSRLLRADKRCERITTLEQVKTGRLGMQHPRTSNDYVLADGGEPTEIGRHYWGITKEIRPLTTIYPSIYLHCSQGEAKENVLTISIAMFTYMVLPPVTFHNIHLMIRRAPSEYFEAHTFTSPTRTPRQIHPPYMSPLKQQSLIQPQPSTLVSPKSTPT
jgi:hypothetical protein